jgi:DNA excision repair protein ERCC-3
LTTEYEQAAEEINKTVAQLDNLKGTLQNILEEQHEEATEEHTPEPSDQEPEERISFFPSRREIVVDQPKGDTRGILSKSSHLVDSTGDAYMYKVSPQDVWNTPYDSFNDLRSDLRTVVGEDWDDGFESRIQDDWNRAHQFYLVTRQKDTGKPFSVLRAQDSEVFEDVAKRKLQYSDHYVEFLSDTEMRISRGAEAEVKEKLYDEGYPVIDQRQLDEGDELEIELVADINLRDYQKDWVDHFTDRKAGVFVGPSGSGKTVSAIGAMTEIHGESLILVPNRELAQQWKQELIDKTNLSPKEIGEYHGGKKQLRPVTVATYDTAAMTRHRKLFNNREWGLVVADECHHAVADTWKRFRSIQSTARLGLSATPVRESGDAKEIYTLIGPPVGTDWGKLFSEGWVAKPNVEVIKIPWISDNARERYITAEGSQKMIEAAKNTKKLDAIKTLLNRHSDDKALIFVDWIDQGEKFAKELGLPFIYGKTSHRKRDQIYEDFRNGEITSLIISRVGDEGIDLPDAEVAIIASTLGSSRSQTGQRAGRTMRPLGDSQVYILLTKGSGEADWGRESTQYLAEKGIDVSASSYEELKASTSDGGDGESD